MPATQGMFTAEAHHHFFSDTKRGKGILVWIALSLHCVLLYDLLYLTLCPVKLLIKTYFSF